MPRVTAQTANFQDTSLIAEPFINSLAALARLYQWQRCELPNLLNDTMDPILSAVESLVARTSQSPQSFSRFADLPPELRIKIWQHAMPAPRTVVVKSPYGRCRKPDTTPKSLEDAVVPAVDQAETWKSNTQIPALLHVNSEARHEALKHYKLSLGVAEHESRIYVDFTRDTLFFGNAELKPECSSLWGTTRDMEQVQRLAVVPEGAWRVLRWKKVDLNGLQKMIFVHDSEKLILGPTPELVEDEAHDDIDELVERIEEAHESTTAAEGEKAMKQRMQEAREELDTLMTVLPTQWEKEPAVATAVFRKARGDRWAA
jgi:hypothetical protein